MFFQIESVCTVVLVSSQMLGCFLSGFQERRGCRGILRFAYGPQQPALPNSDQILHSQWNPEGQGQQGEMQIKKK